MITAFALDDEPLALRLLEAFAKRTDFIHLAATFTSPAEAVAAIRQKAPDLLFLDIQMPGISGVAFAQKLPSQVGVIFTTAFSEYAVEGFNLQAVDYLLKPFSFERFLQAAERARQHINHTKAPQHDLFIKADHGLTRIDPERILYLENVANYVKIHLTTGRYLLVRSSMKEMEEKLREWGFLRIHRSYIIPLAKVLSVRGKTVDLGYTELPVGVNFWEEVQRIFANKLR